MIKFMTPKCAMKKIKVGKYASDWEKWATVSKESRKISLEGKHLS